MTKDKLEEFDSVEQVADGIFICKKGKTVILYDENNSFESKQVEHIIKVGSIYLGSELRRASHGIKDITLVNGFVYFSKVSNYIELGERCMMVPTYNNRILIMWQLDNSDGAFTVYDTDSGEAVLSIPTKNHDFEVKTCNGHEYSVDIVIDVYNNLMARQLVGSLEESYGVSVLPDGKIIHGKYPELLDEFFNKQKHFDDSTCVIKGNRVLVTLETGKTEKYNLFGQMYN